MTDNPSVLYFSRSCGLHDRHFLDLIRSWGLRVWFLSLEAESVPAGLPAGVTPLAFSQPNDSRSVEGRRAMAFELASMVETLRPGVIHVGPVHDCGHIAALAGVKPLLVMSWGSDLLLDSANDLTVREAARTALMACQGFCCDCQTVARSAAGLASLEGVAQAVFPWGTDCQTFTPLAANTPVWPRPAPWREATVVLSLRAFEPLYGLDTVLEAFALARTRNPALRLLLPGQGSLDSFVRHQVAALDLTERVLLPGTIAHSDLPPYYRAADIYLSASRSDGSSVSLIEALASGLPVVVSDLPANREWVRQRENGWLAATDEPADFAEGLLWSAGLGPVERHEIARRNRQLALAKADWKANAPRLLELYRHLTAKSS